MANPVEEQLKTILSAGNFQEAERLLPEYTQEVMACILGPSSRQEQQQVIESFHNLVSLARVMRAHLSTQLAKLHRQSCCRYDGPNSEQHSWHFEG